MSEFITLPVSDDAAEKPRLQRLGTLIAIGLILGLATLLGWGLASISTPPPDSRMAAGFSLTSFHGETISLGELRGQVVVLNFWASWCGPCRDEAAALEATWRKYRDKGVFFIGVDYVDTEKEALAFLEEFDVTYFNGPDRGSRISRAYRIRGVPETFYIGRNGEIRGLKFGPVSELELERKIEELLAEPVPDQ